MQIPQVASSSLLISPFTGLFLSSYEYMPDPEILEPSEIVVQGTSTEFEGGFFESSDDTYMNLTWYHIAGTSLEKTDSIFLDRYPYYTDFVLFYQEFEWISETLPIDANFSFVYKTVTSGDFASTLGDQLFRVYAWLIDSSGNWEFIYESTPSHPTELSEHFNDLNFFDLMSGWEGMITSEGGIQEDPTDYLRVAIGLAPSEEFDTYEETHPWQEYTGTVSLLVTKMSLVVWIEEPDLVDPLFPVMLFGIIAFVVVVFAAIQRGKS